MRPLVRASFGTGLLGLGLGLGCATARPEEQRQADTERTVETLRAQNATYARQIEELENRVFILTDQLESRRVDAARAVGPDVARPARPEQPATEALPKVRLERGAPTPPGTPEPPPASLIAESEVELAGEALLPSSRRPVLHLEGAGHHAPIEVLPSAPPAAEAAATRPGPAVATRPAPSSRPAPPVATAAAPAPVAVVGEGQSPLALYKQSLEHLRGGRHDDAISGFRAFVRLHGAHDYADNAQYWLGECYYDRKDFTAAAREFRRVVERFPQGNKVPDAMLKGAFALLAAGGGAPGRQALEELVRTFPRHEAATLAQAKLTELDRAAVADPAPTPASSSLIK
jgi:tol-pal system protein YbgF